VLLQEPNAYNLALLDFIQLEHLLNALLAHLQIVLPAQVIHVLPVQMDFI